MSYCQSKFADVRLLNIEQRRPVTMSPITEQHTRQTVGTVTQCRLCLKCDDTRAETRFRLSAKRTSPFKSAGVSVQSTTGSRDVRISGSNAGYTMFRGSVKRTGYPLHSPVSPSLPLPFLTVCHHISTGIYHFMARDVIENYLPEIHRPLVHKQPYNCH